MTPDLTHAQPGDRLTLEVEFVRHATARMIVVASGHDGSWCSFPGANHGHRHSRTEEGCRLMPLYLDYITEAPARRRAQTLRSIPCATKQEAVKTLFDKGVQPGRTCCGGPC